MERKEAIEVIKKNWPDSSFTMLREALETLIPELKESEESEDERIRKELITFFQRFPYERICDAGTKVKDAVAWLEKQGGEQNLTLPKWKYKKDNTPLLRDSLILNKYGCVAESPSGALVSDVWVIDYAELAKLPKEEIEKQGKNNMGISEATKQELEDNLNKALETETPESCYEFLDEQGEQKPYGQRQECVDCQFNYAGECKGSCAMKRGEQNPAWSEWDEKIYNLLYEEYENIAYYSHSREKAEDIPGEVLGWLKSLKDRYTWKPSEEQMDALHDAAVYVDKSMFPYPKGVLMKLYEQLKKLREE